MTLLHRGGSWCPERVGDLSRVTQLSRWDWNPGSWAVPGAQRVSEESLLAVVATQGPHQERASVLCSDQERSRCHLVQSRCFTCEDTRPRGWPVPSSPSASCPRSSLPSPEK